MLIRSCETGTFEAGVFRAMIPWLGGTEDHETGSRPQVRFDGDVASGHSALRDYINATIGFNALAEATYTPAKSLMRLFGPKGNPTAANLFAVIDALHDKTGVRLEGRAVS
jgi:hypothetical protein